jgi:hypothetical protein
MIRALTMGLLGRPLVLMVVAGLFFSISAYVDLLGSLLGVTLTLAAGFAVFRAAADDEPFDWLRIADPVEELAIPTVKGLVALAPAILVVAAGITFPVVREYEIAVTHKHSLAVTLALSPSFWLISLPCIAYVPLALLNAATAQSWAAILDVRRTIGFVKRRKNDCKLAIAVPAAGFFATLIFSLLLPRGWFGMFFAGTLAAATGIATMRVLAEFVFLDPEWFGWGRADESMVELGDPAAPAMEEDVAPVQPAKSMSTTLEGQIRAALDAKDAKLALTLFTSVPQAERQLTPPTLTRVGQAAAFLEEYSAALAALLAAAAPPVPESAKPLVIAAKILDERLRDLDGARRLYNQVLTRFPGTQAADYAKQQLADPRFFLAQKVG